MKLTPKQLREDRDFWLSEAARLRKALKEWVEYVEIVCCGDCYHSTIYEEARAALSSLRSASEAGVKKGSGE